MIVCEYEFNKPDPKNPRHSLVEADIYGWIPEEFWSEIRDHRLSLRKNLKTGKFELSGIIIPMARRRSSLLDLLRNA